ncbi:MAG TPA: Trm112 family protein [Pyrinomonadaceae bacterium]|nr:Trm112 family protein [Pyrinomonadaceae bacterium]
MKVTRELVEMMICPECKARVELKQDGSGIRCTGCRRVYPIHRYPNGDEIPGMVAEEATIEDEEAKHTA